MVVSLVRMADFDLDSFVSAPTVEQLGKCRKENVETKPKSSAGAPP